MNPKLYSAKSKKHPCSKCGFTGTTAPVIPDPANPKTMLYFCLGCIGRKVGYHDRKIRNRPTGVQTVEWMREALVTRDAEIAKLKVQVEALVTQMAALLDRQTTNKPMAQQIRELAQAEPGLSKAQIARRLGASKQSVNNTLRQV